MKKSNGLNPLISSSTVGHNNGSLYTFNSPDSGCSNREMVRLSFGGSKDDTNLELIAPEICEGRCMSMAKVDFEEVDNLNQRWGISLVFTCLGTLLTLNH